MCLSVKLFRARFLGHGNLPCAVFNQNGDRQKIKTDIFHGFSTTRKSISFVAKGFETSIKGIQDPTTLSENQKLIDMRIYRQNRYLN